MEAAVWKNAFFSSGETSGGVLFRDICEVFTPLPEKMMYMFGVKRYDESSDTVFASDCGLFAAAASIPEYLSSAAAAFFSRRVVRKLSDSTPATVSAGSANCSARSISPARSKSRSEERRVGKECRSGWWRNH